MDIFPYKLAVSKGGLEALVDCAAATDGETRDQVFWTLGNIALDCPTCKEKVILNSRSSRDHATGITTVSHF